MFRKIKYIKRIISIIILSFATTAIMGQMEDSQLQASLLLGYKAGYSNGLNIGTNLTFNKRIGIDFRYTKSFFSEFETSIPIFLNKSNNQFYIYPGYGFYQKGNITSYEIQINSLNAGVGYKSDFGRHFFINTRLSFVKYLNESYKSKDISSFEKYNLNEKLFIELSLSVGYYFGFNSLHKK